jgi:LCP family protein required for cell wall assembly
MSLVAAALLVAIAVGGVRILGFLESVGNLGSPISLLQKQVEPPAGSIPYKLGHSERVNLLLLGYGGVENDAPWLTDSIMVVSIDPGAHRTIEVSLPRDLMVDIAAFNGGKTAYQKLNVAYEIGMDDADWPGKKPQYTGRMGGGRLAMDTVATVTGLQLDGFVAVDFKAFRDLVNALGGVQVCLDTALDDNQYPDYHNGYIKGGIHFAAGCQQVDGERALQLARSRHASQPEQQSDYGRARRQQQILNGVRHKVQSLNAISKAPQLMDVLQKDYVSSLDLNDLQALYAWGGKLPDGAFGHFGITEDDLVARYYMQRGSCGAYYADVLCPVDPSFRQMHAFFASLFVDPKVLAEKAPVRIVNASATLEDMGDRVTNALKPFGFQLSSPVRRKTLEKSVIYDYSGGRYGLTAQWLGTYFGAQVVTPSPSTPAPGTASESGGLVVVLGRDFALRWIGQGN